MAEDQPRDELGRFTFTDGGAGINTAGEKISIAIKNAAGDGNSIIKNTANKIETGQSIPFSELASLYNSNPKLAEAVSWVQQNVVVSFNNNKFPDNYIKDVFDKMTSVKDYAIYRTDNRFDKGSGIKVGDTIDLSDRMYHATSEKATTDIYNRGSAYTLSIKNGHALKLGYGKASNLPGDNEIHMISNKYKVSKIEDNFLHLEEI